MNYNANSQVSLTSKYKLSNAPGYASWCCVTDSFFYQLSINLVNITLQHTKTNLQNQGEVQKLLFQSLSDASGVQMHALPEIQQAKWCKQYISYIVKFWIRVKL